MKDGGMSTLTEVPSPFCGIGCDDLTIEVAGTALRVAANGCAVNTPAFEQALGDPTPRLDGVAVSLDEAIEHAARYLREAALPLVGGCATDVAGMRAALALAERLGAIVDQMAFNAARRNVLALQDSGWMTTTLAEVRNRCDVLLVAGMDLPAKFPRFFERYFWVEDTLTGLTNTERQVIYLGKAPSGQASVSPDGRAPWVLPCHEAALPHVVAALKALLAGSRLEVERIDDIALSDLQCVAEKLRDARYGVVAWSGVALAYSHAELTVQTLCDIVKLLNRTTRCAGLPLSGKEGDQTAYQVSGWTTGYPPRLSFARGYPEYDPYLFDTQRLLASGEVDALLWISAFNVNNVPPLSDKPTIVLGRCGMNFARWPKVYIPIGTPGIDHAGHAFRSDNVVAIHLKQLRESGLPSTAMVLNQLLGALHVAG